MDGRYEITVASALSEQWVAWLQGVETLYDPAQKQTIVIVDAVDQAALHGILNRILDLGLHLVSVQQRDAEQQNDDKNSAL